MKTRPWGRVQGSHLVEQAYALTGTGAQTNSMPPA
jgi:hypothetical protein